MKGCFRLYSLIVVLSFFMCIGANAVSNYYFSVDIGSDWEVSDPITPGTLDPGDIYVSSNATLVKDDILILLPDPPPLPPVPVGVPGQSPENYAEYFDMDGEDQLSVMIEIWGDTGFTINASAVDGLWKEPHDLHISFDDDLPPGWPASDVPVLVPPSHGITLLQDEILTGNVWRSWVTLTGATDEMGLGLGPNPDNGIEELDDDVDALDVELHQFWYWTCDHEAHYGFDPGAIYVTDRLSGIPNWTLVISQARLGLSEPINPWDTLDADVDAFEFCTTDDPDILTHFGVALSNEYLAVVFSVDSDDPLTQTLDESGGLNSNQLYISLLNFVAPMTIGDNYAEDIDAVAFWDEEIVDFGDAPDPSYPTLLASGGARHVIVTGGPYLGPVGDMPDPELDGQQDPNALGDDSDGNDDEDGVIFPIQPMIIGVSTNFKLIVNGAPSGGAFVQLWIDWNGNGSWADVGEYVIPNVTYVNGVHTITVVPPPNSPVGPTFSRCRISTLGGLGIGGPAADGEVEDHKVTLTIEGEETDYGDAPDPLYPTLKINNGAGHIIGAGGPYLGVIPPDAELDGQQDPNALGDDNAGFPDDEDGVALPTQPLMIGVPANLSLIVSGGGGTVELWIDWDGNGSWADAGEHVVSNVVYANGTYGISITPPANAVVGSTFLRCRINTAGGLSFVGMAGDGEVEDHKVIIEEAPVPKCSKWLQPPDRDFGLDLPTFIIADGEMTNQIYRLADDWWCDGRPITAIRWWGSYLENDSPERPQGAPVAFVLRWYTNVPSNSTVLFGHPGVVIKEVTANLAPEGMHPVPPGIVEESPYWPVVKPPDMEFEFEYYLELEDPWVEKENNIYWLNIEAVYNAPPGENIWGWATSSDYDKLSDAVVWEGGMFPDTWAELMWPVYPWMSFFTGYEPFLFEHELSLDLAFEMLTDVCQGRCKKWEQPPDMLDGVDKDSWRRKDESSNFILRADDFISDGRPISDVHWWGSYMGWMGNVVGSVTNPIPWPTNANSRLLGFDLSWHLDEVCLPGTLLTNIFVDIDDCYEVFYGTITNLDGTYEQEYQYYVDLAGVSEPWYELAGTHYWINIQAVLPVGFQPLEDPHRGWGWVTTPQVDKCSSAKSHNGTIWVPGHEGDEPPFEFDLAFELTTTEIPATNSPWYKPVRFNDMGLDSSGATSGWLVSTGGTVCGIQVLQEATNLLDTPVNWYDITTNTMPNPLPYTWHNMWNQDILFYRIMQRNH